MLSEQLLVRITPGMILVEDERLGLPHFLGCGSKSISRVTLFILNHCILNSAGCESPSNIPDVVIHPSTLRPLCPPTRSGHRGAVACCLLIGQSPVLGRANGDMNKGARQSAARCSSANHLASRGPLKVTD